MRKSVRFALGVAGAAALMGGLALPASAATTPVTATVEGGTLNITAPETSFSLGAVKPGATTTATAMGAVVVTDTRAGTAGWEATATIDAFAGTGPTPPTMDATVATYTAPTADKTGSVTVTSAGTVTDLSAGPIVQAATAVTGNNTATWTPTLQVTAPAQALADTYTATLTHSVA